MKFSKQLKKITIAQDIDLLNEKYLGKILRPKKVYGFKKLMKELYVKN